MTKNIKMPNKDDLAIAALKLAEFQGWETVTLQDIALELQIPLSELPDLIDDKADILSAIGRMIDRKTLENLSEPDPSASPRDALFEIMMERFDVLNEYRGGITAILNGFKTDPKQALFSMPHLCRSMGWMLEAAKINTSGWRGAAVLSGMTGMYLKVLYVWLKDESPDMTKTMAALDKALNRAEKMAEMIGF